MWVFALDILVAVQERNEYRRMNVVNEGGSDEVAVKRSEGLQLTLDGADSRPQGPNGRDRRDGSSASCGSEGGRPIKALIVDDDAIVRWLARSALSKHGFVVAEVETGEQALEAYAASCPDIVLLGINLPGID